MTSRDAPSNPALPAPPEPRCVRLEREGHLAAIILDRPQALNAISSQLAAELIEVLAALRDDHDVWVALLRSSSERAFCVGADLKERQGMDLDGWRWQRALFTRMFRALYDLEMPVIAEVAGYCLGGGLELAMLCDFIYAGEQAEFGLPEVRVGIIPGGAGTQSLPRLVGRTLARELIFTGRRISAQEAQRIGLVNRVVPQAELSAAVREVAEQILANGPLAVRQAKRAISRGVDADFLTGWALESEAYTATLLSEDRVEGIRAFNEKRRPRFRGV